MSDSARIACEIIAPKRQLVAELCRIARTCARDRGQRLEVRAQCAPSKKSRPAPATVTLHLSVELAAAQHPVWCLACQLACFCPSTRVSVLVHGESTFQSPASNPLRAAG